VGGHLLGAERGVPGERYVLNGGTLSSREALEIVAELSGVRHEVRFLPPRLATAGGALVEAGFRLRGRTPPVCREMVRTLLHGHRYDGSRAERELGLRYTPIAETLGRTIEWAEREGLVKSRVAAPGRGYQGVMDRKEHPAKPEQSESFERGLRDKPDPSEEELRPDFARGIRKGEPGEEGRFSEGEEALPDSPEKHEEGSFSDSVERSPTSD
jgi:hypothetical protein